MTNKIILDFEEPKNYSNQSIQYICCNCDRVTKYIDTVERKIKINKNNDSINITFCDNFCMLRFIYNNFIIDKDICKTTNTINKNAYSLIKITCVCGSIVRKCNYTKHIHTTKHKKYIK